MSKIDQHQVNVFVNDRDGKPIAGALIRAFDGDEEVGRAEMGSAWNAPARFTFSPEFETVRFEASVPGQETQRKTVNVNAGNYSFVFEDVGEKLDDDSEAKPVPGNIWIPALLFTASCLIFLFVAFFVGDLKPDQRRILNAIFSLLAGFATFFIGGTAFIKLTGDLKRLKVLFTGSAGVAVFVFVFLHPIFADDNQPGQKANVSQTSEDLSSKPMSTAPGTGTATPTNPGSQRNATPNTGAGVARYVTYVVSGIFEKDYKLSPDSKVVVDRDTGLALSASLAVLAPDGTKEEFVSRPVYNTDRMWQWQNQGSKGGSLDFQDQKYTFVRYSGGYVLSNSSYWTPAIGHNITSADTKFKAIASSESFP